MAAIRYILAFFVLSVFFASALIAATDDPQNPTPTTDTTTSVSTSTDNAPSTANAPRGSSNSASSTNTVTKSSNTNNATKQAVTSTTEDAPKPTDATADKKSAKPKSNDKNSPAKPKEDENVNSMSTLTIDNNIKPDDTARAKLEDNLGIKNPVFFISEDINSYNYSITTDICNIINSASDVITCLVYPVDKIQNIPSYIRRGVNSDKYRTTGVNGDFLIVRSDLLKLATQDGKGPLGNSPDLDVLMYLNGEYFFMFTDLQRESFSLEQLVAVRNGGVISIGYLNPQSRSIFESVIKPMFPKARFVYKRVKENELKNNICYPNDIDVYIYLGFQFTEDIKSAFNTCARNIVPLTFSDQFLSNLLEKNPVLSVANVMKYYDSTSVISYLETFVRVEKKYKEFLEQQQQAAQPDDKEDKGRVSKNSMQYFLGNTSVNRRVITQQNAYKDNTVRTTVRTTPRNENRAQPVDKDAQEAQKEDQKLNDLREKANKDIVIKSDDIGNLPGSKDVLGNKFVGVFPSLKKSLLSDTTPRTYISSSTTIKTFGIRNALVASRYTKQDNVIKVFDILVRDYLLMKDSFLTPDMSTFSLSDIVLGTSKTNKLFSYHPAIYSYPRLMLENGKPKTKEQSAVIRMLTTSLRYTKPPAIYGPENPSDQQLSLIYQKLRDLNTRKQELSAIKIFQRDINNVDQALKLLREGKEIPDSILRTTGLLDTEIIKGDNVTVLPANIANEQEREDYSGEGNGDDGIFANPEVNSAAPNDQEQPANTTNNTPTSANANTSSAANPSNVNPAPNGNNTNNTAANTQSNNSATGNATNTTASGNVTTNNPRTTTPTAPNRGVNTTTNNPASANTTSNTNAAVNNRTTSATTNTATNPVSNPPARPTPANNSTNTIIPATSTTSPTVTSPVS